MKKVLVMTLVIAFILSAMASSAWAKEPAYPELTMNDVINKALENDKSLKSKEVTEEQAWEKRENASENVYFTPSGGGAVNAEAEAAFTGVAQADLNYMTKKKDIEKRRKEVVLEAYTKYIEILQSQEKINAAQAELDRDMAQLRSARVGERVGTVSKTQIVNMDAAVKAAGGKLEALKLELDKKYIELNDMIGLWPEDRPVLVDKVQYEKFQVDDLKAEASRAESNSEDLWTLEQLVKLQQMDLSYFNYGPGSGQLQPYEIEKYDIETAKLDRDSARQSINKAVYTLYEDIMAIEEQYDILQASAGVAEENLRVVEIQRKVGMATEDDIKNAKAELVDVQQQIADINYNHALLIANYKKLTGADIVVDVSPVS